MSNYHLVTNTNPLLADLIIETSMWDSISSNPNIGLTDFILSHPDEINYIQLSRNTNPLLAELIIKNKSKSAMGDLFRNSNTGLTNFIIENYHADFAHFLGQNINPELADFVLVNTNREPIKHSRLNLFKTHSFSQNSATVRKVELFL